MTYTFNPERKAVTLTTFRTQRQNERAEYDTTTIEADARLQLAELVNNARIDPAGALLPSKCVHNRPVRKSIYGKPGKRAVRRPRARGGRPCAGSGSQHPSAGAEHH